MRSGLPALLFLAVVALAVPVGCTGEDGNTVVAVGSQWYGHAPVWVGMERGIFEKHGFKVEWKTIGKSIDAGQIPVYVERFGSTRDEIFVTAHTLREELGADEYEKLPSGAIGLYTYYERLAQGLRQLMAGSRKFSLEHVSRDDLSALTPEAARVTGLPYVMDVDREQVDQILRW